MHPHGEHIIYMYKQICAYSLSGFHCIDQQKCLITLKNGQNVKY